MLLALPCAPAQESLSTDESKLRALENIRSAGMFREHSPSQLKYVRSNITRTDIWETVRRFETERGVRLDGKSAITILAEYLVAEQDHIDRAAGTANASVIVAAAGQRALQTSLKELVDEDEVSDINGLLANELGKRPLTLPRRNKFGKVTVTSKPSGAEIRVDDSVPVASTQSTLIVLTGERRISCRKPPYKDYFQIVKVEPNRSISVNCVLTK